MKTKSVHVQSVSRTRPRTAVESYFTIELHLNSCSPWRGRSRSFYNVQRNIWLSLCAKQVFSPIFLVTQHVYGSNKSWSGRRIFVNVNNWIFRIPKKTRFFFCSTSFFLFCRRFFFLFRTVVVTRVSGVPGGVCGSRDETSGNERPAVKRARKTKGRTVY